MQEGKVVIVSAPSGAGKTTIVKHLMECGFPLGFSVSACSRNRRPGEVDGRDYYFLSPVEFQDKIRNNEFLEWEEVYQGMFYGTLKSEIDRIWATGRHVIFDVDVKGGVNLKKYFGAKALSVFISPPSYESLRERLKNRGTEDADSLEKRLARAKMEMEYHDKFDRVIVNDTLEKALKEAKEAVKSFLENDKL